MEARSTAQPSPSDIDMFSLSLSLSLSLSHTTLLVSLSCQPPQLQEQRDDQYVALERRRNGSYVIGRLWYSWGAERGRGKGTFSRRFLEKQRRGDQAWLRPDMPSYEREKMMRRRVAPRFCISLSLAGWLTGTPSRDYTTRTERQRAQGRLGNRSHPTLIKLSGNDFCRFAMRSKKHLMLSIQYKFSSDDYYFINKYR